MDKKLKLLFLFNISLLISACTPPPPQNAFDVCEIFTQYPKWYWAAKSSEQQWGVPVDVQMAILFQESSFKGKAKPPRTKILWVIPWKRPTSAYGYSQAIDQTWENYKKQTGHWHAQRTNFRDAADFVGWYGATANRKLGIPKNNAYDIYLAYHEGFGGYARCTYKSQTWLMNAAKKVSVNADRYKRQLHKCEDQISHSWW